VGAPPPYRISTVVDREPLDTLVSGDEREPWTTSPRVAAGLLAAVLVSVPVAVTAGLVQTQRANDARFIALREAGRVLPMALRTGPALVPRDRGPDRPGASAQARVHVEVVNRGPLTVRVLSGDLTPGPWVVDVVDRDVVLPGESLVLALHRSVDCSGQVPLGPAPEQLVLTGLLPDSSPRTVALDLAREQEAYAGSLDDALRDPGRACSAPVGPWTPTGS
jgi:hypothetical protein